MPTMVHEAVSPAVLRTPDVLVRSIQSATHRQVSELHVDCSDDRVTVTGRSRTYYVKQLVTQAILQSLPSARLQNDILVTAH
jgi:hypothetical protein